jgi:hypothetical protein
MKEPVSTTARICQLRFPVSVSVTASRCPGQSTANGTKVKIVIPNGRGVTAAASATGSPVASAWVWTGLWAEVAEAKQ